MNSRFATTSVPIEELKSREIQHHKERILELKAEIARREEAIRLLKK